MTDSWEVTDRLLQIEEAISQARRDQERFQEGLMKLLKEISDNALDLVFEIRTANQSLSDAVRALEALDERFNPRTDIDDRFP